jgi:hypothetical protein
MIRAVSSVTGQMIPPKPPLSSGTGLYEKVTYISSGNPFRSKINISASSYVPSLRCIAYSTRGPSSGQTSCHTMGAGSPSALGCFACKKAAYPSL